MVQKRPFDEEEHYEVSPKFPKQLRHNEQLALFSEINPEGEIPVVDIAEGYGRVKDGENFHEKFPNDHLEKQPLEYEEDADYSEEDVDFHEPLRAHLPEYFYLEHRDRALSRCEDVYTLHMQLPPRKPVPVGPNYQAVIPPWNTSGAKGSSSSTCTKPELSSSYVNGGLAGNIVLPMPDAESNHDDVGAGRSDCMCRDRASIRCIRQHVSEAREKLWKNLGTEKFEGLGFFDMGEQVAEKWTEEEEQLFHEVVVSNPPSTGSNFWNTLSLTFPSRTKLEIASYYFNVFMLRRRTEQNRFDPVSADSDNDEWMASDDDDDSVVESPLHNVGLNSCMEDGINDCDEDVADETYDEIECGTFETFQKGFEDGRSHIISKREDETWVERRDQEHVEDHDDSCTSFENVEAPMYTGSRLKDETRDRWSSGYTGLSNRHEYSLEQCEAKLWDDGYVSFPKSDVEFLPTCSVIEEVFDDGSWNCKMDGK